MTTSSRTVTSPVVFELIGPHATTSVGAELRYDPSDPYAVAVAFLNEGTEVVWMFGRDLLIRGLSEPVGEGDVQVFPTLDDEGRAQVGLLLHAPGGRSMMKVPAGDVLGFLALSTRAVWPGTEAEHVSTDAAIAELLVGD
jgi:hypothetical protein